MKSESHSAVSDSLPPHGLYSPWSPLGQNTGVGSLSLLQGIFPTQGSNPGIPHCRGILHQLNHKGSPRILEWVAYPISSGSSRPRDWTGVSCISCGFLTNWAVRETMVKVSFLHWHFFSSLNLLISLIYFFHPFTPFSSGNHLFVLCIYYSVPVLLCVFICFVFQILHINEIIWCLSFSDLFSLT